VSERTVACRSRCSSTLMPSTRRDACMNIINTAGINCHVPSQSFTATDHTALHHLCTGICTCAIR